jgi:ATP-dependent DNA helicase RecG
VVENAERFGLAQLHQLRGRVGRGQYLSTCVLISDHSGEETRRRLQVMCATTDGFRIADEDLKMRGPGDFFGSRQHGLPQFKAASLTSDLEILHLAKSAAETALADPNYVNDPTFPALQARIQNLFREDNTMN